MAGGGGSDSGDRPRRSWSEIDRMRDRGRSGDRSDSEEPRSEVAKARARTATAQYLKNAERLFRTDQGGAGGKKLAEAVREQHGSPGLAEACRAYRDALGIPDDPELLGIFLDSGDRELVVSVLGTLLELRAAGRLDISPGLRSQVRMLSGGFDDPVAEAAEALLARL
jgi:hypothetical protein